MKILILLIMMLSAVPELFARDTCPAVQGNLSKTVKSMGLSAESMNCVATKNLYNCQKVEDDLDKDQKYKVIQCDATSLEANRLGKVSIADCIWNGFKISGESLVDMAQLPGAIAGAIAKGFQETQICNASVDKKREILNAFNMTVDDPRYRLEESRLGSWLNDAPCSEIEKLLSARYQNYQTNIVRERMYAINAGKKPAPLRTENKSSGPGLVEMLSNAMTDMKSTYECYTPKVKAEMICAGVTSLLADAALGGGVAIAAKRMAAVVKSSKAAARIRNAAAAGEAVDLADAAVLLNRDRIRTASVVLNRTGPMSEVQSKAVIAAHEVGKKQGRGFFTYTKDDIAEKARILREAGFDPKDTRKLMESGVTGNFRKDEWARNALFGYMNKILAISATAVQKESFLAIHDLGLSSSAGFADKAKEILKKASFSDEQIKAILKAKADNEGGTLATLANVEKKAAEDAKKAAEALKAAQDKAAEMAKQQQQQQARSTASAAEDSPGRKAALSNFRDDEVIKYKFVEVPEGATKEVIEGRLNARKKSAVEMLTQLERKYRGFDVQDAILENGSLFKKAKKLADEAEEQMSKLPAKGADMRRKEFQDKIDRSRASMEMFQQKCKTILELYRVAYNISQYMQTYDTAYDRNCK